MASVVEAVAHQMPAHLPRYLMGVGRPEDLIMAIGAGIDMFDCVMPTRNARNGQLFTEEGRIVISNHCHQTATLPIDPGCRCYTCQNFTRAYLRHLYLSKELLYNHLATLHNVHFTLELVRRARTAILQGGYSEFAQQFLQKRQAAAADSPLAAS
jgi:queuine tRNA-ribosyltransferase